MLNRIALQFNEKILEILASIGITGVTRQSRPRSEFIELLRDESVTNYFNSTELKPDICVYSAIERS